MAKIILLLLMTIAIWGEEKKISLNWVEEIRTDKSIIFRMSIDGLRCDKVNMENGGQTYLFWSNGEYVGDLWCLDGTCSFLVSDKFKMIGAKLIGRTEDPIILIKEMKEEDSRLFNEVLRLVLAEANPN